MEKMNMTPAALAAAGKGDIKNFLIAATPGGIEAQEAAGQQDFVASETLPKDMGRSGREPFEKMGFVFGDDVDDIFVSVQFPEGWKKQATDHSMWSDLLDEKGRIRASIFYKAAFYDRKAHISLQRRFSAGCRPEDDYKTNIGYEKRQAGNWYGSVKDQDEIIFQTEAVQNPSFEVEEELGKKAVEWLNEEYPEWNDPTAYWD